MNTIHTLHDFLLHSESVVYIIMGVSLVVFFLFWLFLTGRDHEDLN